MARTKKTGLLGAFVFALLLVFAALGAAVYYMTAMPGASYSGALPAASSQQQDLAIRLQRHVTAIASEPHNVDNYPALEAAARYIEASLAGYGYSVKRQVYTSKAGAVRNLEVSITNGNRSGINHPIIVVGAHYDSANGAPGANDNGTGTAAVIELARLLKDAKPAGEIEIKLVLYVSEEPPYFKTTQMGSYVHASELHARGANVIAMLSLETIGYYSDEKGSQRYPFPLNLLYPDTGNFVGFVGDLKSRALVHRTLASFRKDGAFPSEGVAAPAQLKGIDWSDHWSYRQFGYPAVMITDTATYRYPHYHTTEDTPDKINYERLARVVTGVEQVIRELAK